MSTKKCGFFGLILMLVAAQSALAAAPTRGVSDAYEAYRTTVNQLSRGDISTPTTLAVGFMVANGVNALRQAGHPELAKKYATEWAQRYNRPLTAADWVPTAHRKDDLGDHAPANQWLADFYDKLVKLTRGAVRQIREIEDINTLNYALPIVFAPKGTWRTGLIKDDQIEYRKHFIPFANIVTYWVADKLCEYACTRYVPTIPQLKQVCDPAARELEYYMGRYVSWQISDYIFAVANGSRKDAELAEIAILDYETFEALVLSKVGGLE